MFDAWNSQTHYASADPEIGSENWVTVEWEIIFETDSRMTDGIDSATLIHSWRTKSKDKTGSSLTNGIASENWVDTDEKSSPKTKSL